MWLRVQAGGVGRRWHTISLLTQWLVCAFSAIPLFAHRGCRSRANCTGGETVGAFLLLNCGLGARKGKKRTEALIRVPKKIRYDEEIKICVLLNEEELCFFIDAISLTFAPLSNFLQTDLLTGCSLGWNFTLRSQTICVKNLQGKTRSRQIRLTREYTRAAFSGADPRGDVANYSAAVGRFKSRPNGQRLVKNKLCVRFKQGVQLIYASPSVWTSNSVDLHQQVSVCAAAAARYPVRQVSFSEGC